MPLKVALQASESWGVLSSSHDFIESCCELMNVAQTDYCNLLIEALTFSLALVTFGDVVDDISVRTEEKPSIKTQQHTHARAHARTHTLLQTTEKLNSLCQCDLCGLEYKPTTGFRSLWHTVHTLSFQSSLPLDDDRG